MVLGATFYGDNPRLARPLYGGTKRPEACWDILRVRALAPT
jgi:hypothetical protein